MDEAKGQKWLCHRVICYQSQRTGIECCVFNIALDKSDFYSVAGPTDQHFSLVADSATGFGQFQQRSQLLAQAVGKKKKRKGSQADENMKDGRVSRTTSQRLTVPRKMFEVPRKSLPKATTC